MTVYRVTVSTLNGRQWITPMAMSAMNVLCAASLLYCSNVSAADEEPRAASERRRTTLRFLPPPDDPATESPQRAIPAAPAKHRSLAELRAGLQAIAAEDRKLSGTGIERERQRALLRLRMYRFLCHLPQADLTLELQLNDDALAAAEICRRLGKLSHAPENPGIPDAEFQAAREAASKCNLSFGLNDLTKAIDLWMKDSGAHNLSRLVHRRWCLNPKMLKLGLGRSADFCAMWAFDNSRIPAPEYEFIGFPPPGYVPVDFFGPEYPWSITLNPGKYLAPELEAISVDLLPILEDQADREHPLKIENLTVDTQGFGVNNCVIFWPESLTVGPRQSYQLYVRGLQTIDGTPTSVEFAVRFVDAIPHLAPD
jgi:hypothetical protein